jgi:hypothetical protein
MIRKLTLNRLLTLCPSSQPLWPVPVHPGDRLRLRTTTTETRRSRSKPDRGLVFTHAELLNADDSVVLSLKAMNLLRLRRPRLGLRDGCLGSLESPEFSRPSEQSHLSGM